MSDVDPKQIYKDKMQAAIENFLTAEHEGAEHLAPDTYAWAKAKIYDNKKKLLQNPDDEKNIEEAAEDSSAAAAKLLAIVREKQIKPDDVKSLSPENAEKEAIKNLVNEGGPVL